MRRRAPKQRASFESRELKPYAWEIIHLLLFGDYRELIDRWEFADAFQRKANIDPFNPKPKSK